MSETEALDIVSKMVLNKMKTRPAMITRWGQVLKMLYEEYPEFRPTPDAQDGANAPRVVKVLNPETGLQEDVAIP